MISHIDVSHVKSDTLVSQSYSIRSLINWLTSDTGQSQFQADWVLTAGLAAMAIGMAAMGFIAGLSTPGLAPSPIPPLIGSHQLPGTDTRAEADCCFEMAEDSESRQLLHPGPASDCVSNSKGEVKYSRFWRYLWGFALIVTNTYDIPIFWSAVFIRHQDVAKICKCVDDIIFMKFCGYGACGEGGGECVSTSFNLKAL